MFILYKTTNLINQKYYIGVHKTETKDFDGYFGSGKNLKRSILKYGIENFIRETIQQFDTKELAFIAERLYLEQIDDLNCYNIAEGGHGGYTEYTDERNKKISNKITGIKRSEQTKNKHRLNKQGKYKAETNPNAKKWKLIS